MNGLALAEELSSNFGSIQIGWGELHRHSLREGRQAGQSQKAERHG